MALLSRYLTISRTILRSRNCVAANSSQSGPLGYVISSMGSNAKRACNVNKSSIHASTIDIYSCTPSSFSIRTTQRTFVTRRDSAVNSKPSLKHYLYGHLASSSHRTMCTIKGDERICWNCKKKIGVEIFFCDICKIIQPPLTELTFFEIFGCQETYVLNLRNLTDRYRKLQSMVHPDKFNNSDEAEKHYSAEQSSFINKAYNILLDPLSRATYLLSLKNIEIGESNTVEGEDFLMEIMEINEKLSEVKSMDDLEAIRTSNNDSIDSCIESLTEAFEIGSLDAAKELTIKLRYYRNILEIIKEKTMELDN